MPILSLENPVFISVTGAGRPNSGGTVGVYVAGTSFATPATIYSDAIKTSTLTNPVTLDDSGTKEIWYDVKVDIQEKTKAGVLIRDTLALNPNATATVSTSFNLASNGSFEVDSDSDGQPDSWTLSPYSGSSIAISSTVVTDGTKALEFNTGAAGGGGGTATSAKFPVTEGEAVECRWAFYATNATTLNTFKINWYDHLDVLQSTSTVTMPASGSVPTSWTAYTARVSVAAAATQGEIVLTGIDSGGSNLSAKAYFDGIKVVEVADLEPVIYDSVGNEILSTVKAATAVNNIKIANEATGGKPIISVAGEADTGIIISDSNGVGMLVLESVTSGVNYATISNSAGSDPVAITTSTDDLGIKFNAKNSEEMLVLAAVTDAVNEVTITNAATGNGPIISATGENNVDLTATTKGTGGLNLNTAGSGVVSLNGTAATHTGKGYGGRVLIESQSASSSATIDFTSGIDSTYKMYVVEIINALPANDGAALQFVVSHDTGSTWENDGAVATYKLLSASNNFAILAAAVENTTANGGASGEIKIYDPANTSVHTQTLSSITSIVSTSGDQATTTNGNIYQATTAVDGFRLYFTAGNIASGEFRLYGIIV